MDVSEKPIELSIILPALNEARSLDTLLPELKQALSRSGDHRCRRRLEGRYGDICEQPAAAGSANPYRMGNGAAIKRGARAARGANLAMIDADGQHTAKHLLQLWKRFQQ